MKRYQIIENGMVVNTAIAHTPQGPNWVENDDAGIGWTYDGQVFAAPVVPVPSRKEVIQARLIEIDAISDKPRTRRELALSKKATKDWLQALDDEAAVLRTELGTLP